MEISLAETRELLTIAKRVTPVLTREEFEMVGLIYLGALERLENNMEDTNNEIHHHNSSSFIYCL